MIYILYARASFSTAAKRDGAIQQVTNYLDQPNIASDLIVPAQVAPYDATYKGWPNSLVAECRFRTQQNRDDLWAQLDTYLSQPNAKPVKSIGEHWDQKLDDPNPDADTTRYNSVTKTWV